MRFDTRVAGIPCQVEVTFYSAGYPGSRYGNRGEGIPPEPEEIEFRLLDRKGYRARWLEKKLDEHRTNDLMEQISMARIAERYGHAF